MTWIPFTLYLDNVQHAQVGELLIDERRVVERWEFKGVWFYAADVPGGKIIDL